MAAPVAPLPQLPDRSATDIDTETAIRVHGLRKRYEELEAVRGIDLAVQAGEIFAFLGPNGAGKTTTVEMLEGFRRRDAGEVTVLGVDPAHPTAKWRARIGVVLQNSKMPSELTVRELVERYAGFYPHPRDVGKTIELVGLSDKTKTRAGKLSGGQLRRLDVALAIVGDPELMFLDEPTTGLDPAARRQAWALVEGLRDMGKTVFLTTHYMDEAEALADRVAVISRGIIVAEGSPQSLGGRDTAPVEIRFTRIYGAEPPLPAELAAQTCSREVTIRTREPEHALRTLLDWASNHHEHLAGLEVRPPTLEEIYLGLTGGTA
jgi:ABC-2 type transport system ATP-binding protein